MNSNTGKVSFVFVSDDRCNRFQIAYFSNTLSCNVCYCVTSFQTEPGRNPKKAILIFVIDKGNASSIQYILYSTVFCYFRMIGNPGNGNAEEAETKEPAKKKDLKNR